MIWNKEKLKVDLVQICHKVVKMPAYDNRIQICSPKKETLLKAVLALVITGLVVQVVHIYFTISWYNTIKKLKDDITEHPNNMAANSGSDVTEGFCSELENLTKVTPINETIDRLRTKAVLYSYLGIENLPHGDAITQLLRNHPDVYYIHQLDYWISKVSPAFPKFNQRNMKQYAYDLLSCDHNLLHKLQDSVQKPDGHTIRHHSPGCHRAGCTFNTTTCESRAVRMVDIYKTSGLELQDFLFLNDSLQFVHLAADPRFVILNLWQRLRDDTNAFSVIKDKPIAVDIAREYCLGLTRDIKAVRKLKNSLKNGGSDISHKYLFTRYEDMIENPSESLEKILDFLKLNVTEEMEKITEPMSKVDITLLYEDTEYNVNEIAEKVCAKAMELLGYATANQTAQLGSHLMPYKPWWI